MEPDDPIQRYKRRKKDEKGAERSRMPTNSEKTLSYLLLQFENIIRMKLSGENPTYIEPPRVNFKQDMISVRYKQRKYSPPKWEFMCR